MAFVLCRCDAEMLTVVCFQLESLKSEKKNIEKAKEALERKLAAHKGDHQMEGEQALLLEAESSQSVDLSGECLLRTQAIPVVVWF